MSEVAKEEPSDANEEADADAIALKPAYWILGGILAAWLLTPLVLMLVGGIAERGQFGDQYGTINALFSGLAFSGLVIAIFLQRRELRMQRQELRLQRQELRLQREELKLTREELKRSADAQDAAQKVSVVPAPPAGARAYAAAETGLGTAAAFRAAA